MNPTLFVFLILGAHVVAIVTGIVVALREKARDATENAIDLIDRLSSMPPTLPATPQAIKEAALDGMYRDMMKRPSTIPPPISM